MSIIELTTEAAETVLEEHDFVVLSFVSPNCPACRAFEPVFERVAGRHPEIRFCRVDTVREKGICQALEVEKVPSFAILRENVLLLLQAGGPPEKAFEDVIQQAIDLDMDEVRRNIDREQQEREQQESGEI